MMKSVNVWLPEPRIKQLDQLVEKKEFPNRNEAIREAIRYFINDTDNQKLRALRRIWDSWNQKTLEAKDALNKMYNVFFEGSP